MFIFRDIRTDPVCIEMQNLSKKEETEEVKESNLPLKIHCEIIRENPFENSLKTEGTTIF